MKVKDIITGLEEEFNLDDEVVVVFVSHKEMQELSDGWWLKVVNAYDNEPYPIDVKTSNKHTLHRSVINHVITTANTIRGAN